jgi:hypothetical protein
MFLIHGVRGEGAYKSEEGANKVKREACCHIEEEKSV